MQRNYCYIEGSRFKINNIYRSLRFDVDRLDINIVDGSKPSFIRGFRIVDHDLHETTLIHGEDADNLLFSMSYILCHNEKDDSRLYDQFLMGAVASNNYLIDAVGTMINGSSSFAVH